MAYYARYRIREEFRDDEIALYSAKAPLQAKFVSFVASTHSVYALIHAINSPCFDVSILVVTPTTELPEVVPGPNDPPNGVEFQFYVWQGRQIPTNPEHAELAFNVTGLEFRDERLRTRVLKA